MENTITISTISQERYDELIRDEMRVKLITALYERNNYVYAVDSDIKFLLGIPDKEEKNENNG